MHPSLQNKTLFEQGLSNKLHNPLVIKNKSKTKQSIKQPTSAIPPTTSAALVAPSNEKATLPPVQHQSCAPFLPTPISGISSSVSGPKEKKCILEEYVSKFGSGHQELIITKKKGKLDPNEPLHFIMSSWKGMKPSTDKYYRVKDLMIYNIITIVIQEYMAFSKNELLSIRLINTDFAKMIPKLKRWLQIDFSTLRKPRLNYESHTQIDPHRVCMANTAMAHFGLDPGRFVRWMGDEYTGQHRDAYLTLAAVKGHVSTNNYKQMKRILLNGCPAQLDFEEPLSNKIEMIDQGNSKSFNTNTALVLKTMIKEDRYSHLIPLDEIMCRFSSYCRHTTQTMVIKAGKNDQLCWDGSTTIKPTDIVMNQVTPVIREAPITLGHVKMQLYTDIYNTCVSYPTFTILLAMADVKACFHFPCIHADLTGAFGFMSGGYFSLATAMVFGSTAPASSWEPFRHTIQALSVAYAHHHDLIDKHRKFLDMISWAPLYQAPDLTKAVPCSINTGVLNDQGMKVLLPARIYVDNALTLATSKESMEQVLAALIKAIFVVMGIPDTSVRQCSLAMDKWEKLQVTPIQTMLGLVIDTNRMTVSVPDNYIQKAFVC
jgi:hypothetical protein